MKANMVIEIFPSKTLCTGDVDEDCRFFNTECGWCELFGVELAPKYLGPVRCQACLDTFKEDKK